MRINENNLGILECRPWKVRTPFWKSGGDDCAAWSTGQAPAGVEAVGEG